MQAEQIPPIDITKLNFNNVPWVIQMNIEGPSHNH